MLKNIHEAKSVAVDDSVRRRWRNFQLFLFHV